MNNWRFLLVAVIAVLRPSGYFTKSTFDGNPECCDHRPSFVQDPGLYGDLKTTTNDRLSSEGLSDARRIQARGHPETRSTERLSAERGERLFTEHTNRFNSVARLDRPRTLNAGENRRTRIVRTREDYSRDSLTRYERDDSAYGSARLTRENTQRDLRQSERNYEDRRFSGDQEQSNLQRETRDVVRNDARRMNTRFSSQIQGNEIRRSLQQRVREYNRLSRALLSRETSAERENRRSASDRVDERRQREQGEYRKSRTMGLRDSSNRLSADRLRESRTFGDQTRNVGQIRATNKLHQRDDNRRSTERSERREIRVTESRKISRESSVDMQQKRSVRVEMRRVSRESLRDSPVSSRVLGTIHARNDRRQLVTRSLQRAEREVSARNRDSSARERETSRNRRDVRSAERVDEQREQMYESRRVRHLADLRVRDNSEREISTRSSILRIETNARNIANAREQTTIRNARNFESEREFERRDESRKSRFTVRSDERSVRNEIRRENSDSRRGNNDGDRIRTDVNELRRIDSRREARIDSILHRTKSVENVRDDRNVRERDERRVIRDRISAGRDLNQVRETKDVIASRNEIRNRDHRRSNVNKNQNLIEERFQRDTPSVYRASRTVESRSGRSANDKRVRERDVRDDRNGETRSSKRVEVESYRTVRERMENRDVQGERLADDTSRSIRKLDTRFRSFQGKIDEATDNFGMSWHVVVYTLQGAYLLGLLMQMLTEKSDKGKYRNTKWWLSASKDLVKVD